MCPLKSNYIHMKRLLHNACFLKAQCLVIGALMLMFSIIGFWSCTPARVKQEVVNSESRPNIVVVLVDDMRWDEYGKAGHSYIETPNIDRIASDGVTFKNAFATTPLCSPSRASLLTGLYAHSHGILDNIDRSFQSHKLRTFPATLDSLGYETAFVGKWHMGNDNTRRPGFDFWVCLKGQGKVQDPLLNVNGQEKQVTGYVTDILTDFSLEFINKDRTKPFLLYLSQKALHPNLHQRADGRVVDIGDGGFEPASRHKGMYSDAVFKRRPNAYMPPRNKPALARKIGNLPPMGRETATPEEVIRDRSEMLMAIDEGLGSILGLLEQKEELQNTIVVFTSDHGYWYGEHGLNEERRLAYEEGIRIPLLIRYPPKIKAGSIATEMVLNIDLAPTILELAGHKPGKHIEGHSLVPILGGKTRDWRSSFLIEYYSDKVWPRMINMGYKAVRTERYKYIKYTELSGMDELYDLQKDPYELNNIIDKDKDLQKEMDNLLILLN
jgi:N-acetylglucosamine-6-sulfatase